MDKETVPDGGTDETDDTTPDYAYNRVGQYLAFHKKLTAHRVREVNGRQIIAECGTEFDADAGFTHTDSDDDTPTDRQRCGRCQWDDVDVDRGEGVETDGGTTETGDENSHQRGNVTITDNRENPVVVGIDGRTVGGSSPDDNGTERTVGDPYDYGKCLDRKALERSDWWDTYTDLTAKRRLAFDQMVRHTVAGNNPLSKARTYEYPSYEELFEHLNANKQLAGSLRRDVDDLEDLVAAAAESVRNGAWLPRSLDTHPLAEEGAAELHPDLSERLDTDDTPEPPTSPENDAEDDASGSGRPKGELGDNPFTDLSREEAVRRLTRLAVTMKTVRRTNTSEEANAVVDEALRLAYDDEAPEGEI